MIVLRVMQIVIIAMSLFFISYAIYTRIGWKGTAEERSAFIMGIVIGIVGLLMSFLLRFVVKFARQHLDD